MNTPETNESLQAKVTHLTALFENVKAWRDRTVANVDEDGLVDQHAFIALGSILENVGTAVNAETITTVVEHDVLVTTAAWGQISTSDGAGQTRQMADLREESNAAHGLPVERLTRTKTTITTGWSKA